MGQINIEGLGTIDIAGDEPTKEELQSIEKFIQQNPNMVNSDQYINKEVDDHIESPSFGRLAVEIGGSILGSVFTGGLGLPLVAARLGMLSRPFLARLLKSSLGSGAGAGTGSLVSETFNPSNDPYAAIVRASQAGFVGELVGGPAAIKAFQVMGKIINPKLDKHLVAEKGEAIISGRVEEIANFIQKNGVEEANKKFGQKQVEFARDAIVTPGIAYDSRVLDILENLTEKAFLNKRLLTAKSAVRGLTQEMMQNFNDDLARTAGRKMIMNADGSYDVAYNGADVGQILLNSLSNGKTGYNTFVQKIYDRALNNYDTAIDSLRKSGVGSELLEDVPQAFIKTIGGKRVFSDKIFPTKPLLQDLETYIANDRFALGPEGVAKVQNMIKFLRDSGENMSLKDAFNFQKMINTEAAPLTSANRTVIDQVNKKFRDTARLALYGKDKVNKEIFKDFPVFRKFLDDIEQADEVVKVGKTYFDDDFIQKTFKDLTPNQFGFLEGNGSEVLSNILNHNKPEMFGKILSVLNRGVKDKLIGQEVIENFKTGARSKLFNDLIESSRVDKMVFGREFVPSNMQKNLRQRRELFEQIFTKKQLKQLDDNLTAMNTAYGKLAQDGQLPGGVALTLTQPAAAASIVGGIFTGMNALTLGGVTLVAGPWALSRILTSKSFNTYIRKGFQTLQEEAAKSYKAAGEGNFAGISNFRKTATATRQFMEQLFASNIINRQELEQFEANLPKAINNIQDSIRNETFINEPIDQSKDDLKPSVKTRPSPIRDPIDNALESLEPMLQGPTITAPQSQAPAPRPQASGIASLQNRPEQLQKLEQVGLPLFDRG